MPATPELALPYPALSDAPNVPAAIQALGERVEALLKNNVLKATKSTALSLVNVTETLATFDATFGGSGITVVSTSRLTVSQAGVYQMTARAATGSNAQATLKAMVRKNAAGSSSGGTPIGTEYDHSYAAITAGMGRSVLYHDLVNLAAGDYLEAWFYTRTRAAPTPSSLRCRSRSSGRRDVDS